MSEFPRDPKAIADLFLKKVLARMEANREASKLANDTAHVCAFEADNREDSDARRQLLR